MNDNNYNILNRIGRFIRKLEHNLPFNDLTNRTVIDSLKITLEDLDTLKEEINEAIDTIERAE